MSPAVVYTEQRLERPPRASERYSMKYEFLLSRVLGPARHDAMICLVVENCYPERSPFPALRGRLFFLWVLPKKALLLPVRHDLADGPLWFGVFVWMVWRIHVIFHAVRVALCNESS